MNSSFDIIRYKERKTNSYLVKNQRKSYYYKLEGTCYEKKKKYWNLHIDSFFLNRMRQKAPVRFRRDII
ncbi:hypothetical protein Hanom_Chr10g00913351 [Helianthus anomalus]